ANGSGAELPAFLQPAVNGLGDVPADHPAAALLGACYIADDLHAFLDFWRANPTFALLSVATRKGELVDRRGLVSGGFNKKPANSIVQREIDLRETAKALAEEQKQHDDQKAVIDALNARLAEAERTLEQRRSDVLLATQQVAAVQAEQRNAQRAVEDIAQRIVRMERELTSLEAARNEADARFARAQAGLSEAEARAAQTRESIAQMETRTAELRTDRDVKRDTLSQARLELAERRQKVEVLDRGIADMQRRRQQLAEILVQRQQEIEVWSEQVGELERESDGQRARAAQIVDTLAVAQQQVEQIRSELLEVEREIDAVESAQHSLRSAAEAASSELSRCEIKLAESTSRAEFLAEDVRREFSESITGLDWRQLLWHADDEPPDMKPLDLRS